MSRLVAVFASLVVLTSTWQIAVAGCCQTASATRTVSPNGCVGTFGGYLDYKNTPSSYPGPCRGSLNPIAGCTPYSYSVYTQVWISDESDCDPEVYYSSSTASYSGGVNYSCWPF